MKTKNKVFIDLPNFINSSNGTRCIGDLTENLELQNIKIFKINRNNSFFSRLKNKLNINFSNKDFQIIKENANKGDWLLACDTTPAYLLRNARKYGVKIIWWQLAPYKFLGSNQMPKIGDYSLPFSSYTDPESKIYFYYQPDLGFEWERVLEKIKSKPRGRTLKICLYNGKGRLCKLNKKLSQFLFKYKIEVITRTKPKQRSEYFKTLLGCDGLISFDELTQTNLEAASLGIPVYLANPLFPKNCLKKFNIQELSTRITSSPEKFISMLNKEDFKLKPFDVDYLKSSNNLTINNFIDIVRGNLLLKPLQKKQINSYKKYSKTLISKKVIFPYINGGQAPSSLLIKSYVNNISEENNYIFHLIIVFDFLGHILYKLGLIRICEILFFKAKSFLKKFIV